MNEDKQLYKCLSPTDDVDITPYEKPLDYALDSSDISNIALIGPYASGKSSIIRSYFAKNANQKKPLYLSLAEFNTNDTNEENKDDEHALEIKIVNQLIQKIDIKKTPKSSFKRIERPVNRHYIIAYVLLIALLFDGLYIAYLGGSVQNAWFPYCLAAVLFAILLGMAIFIPHRNSTIHKIGIANTAEIELVSENSASCFDRYLDEIVYLIRNSGCSAIVIEDIDRFRTEQIFKRLREISEIVNYGKGTKIKFIFEINDSLFECESRSKFFDFIIPVIPKVWSYNAAPYMSDRLKGNYSSDLLTRISFFMTNRRIADNICNECNALYGNLQENESPDKLLAIITYKNLYPKDYADLIDHKGTLYTTLTSKKRILAENEKELDNQIRELNLKINAVAPEVSRRQSVRVSIMDQARQLYLPQNDMNTINSILQKSKEAEQTTPNMIKLKKELHELEQKKRTVQESKLSELLRDNKVIDEKGRVIPLEGITRVLVLGGYIDVDYEDYISPFVASEEFSTKEEHGILNNIYQHVDSDQYIDFVFEDPRKILSKLNRGDFSSTSILNHSLFEFAINNDVLDREYIAYLKRTDNWFFMKPHLSNPESVKILAIKTTEIWPDIRDTLIENIEAPNLKLSFVLTSLDTETNITVKSPGLCEYLSKKSKHLNPWEITGTILENMKRNNVKLASLIGCQPNAKALEFIIGNQLFSPTYENFPIAFSKNISGDSSKFSPFEIMYSSNSPASSYYLDNLDIFLDSVPKSLEFTEKPDTLVRIQNDQRISERNVERIIKLCKPVDITDINIINPKYWSTLADSRCIVLNDRNYSLLRSKNKDDLLDKIIKYTDFSNPTVNPTSHSQELWEYIICKQGLPIDKLVDYLKRTQNCLSSTTKCKNIDDWVFEELIKEERINPTALTIPNLDGFSPRKLAAVVLIYPDYLDNSELYDGIISKFTEEQKTKFYESLPSELRHTVDMNIKSDESIEGGKNQP